MEPQLLVVMVEMVEATAVETAVEETAVVEVSNG